MEGGFLSLTLFEKSLENVLMWQIRKQNKVSIVKLHLFCKVFLCYISHEYG